MLFSQTIVELFVFCEISFDLFSVRMIVSESRIDLRQREMTKLVSDLLGCQPPLIPDHDAVNSDPRPGQDRAAAPDLGILYDQRADIVDDGHGFSPSKLAFEGRSTSSSESGLGSLIAMMIFPLQEILHRIYRWRHPLSLPPHQRRLPPQPLLGGVDEVGQALASDGAHGDGLEAAGQGGGFVRLQEVGLVEDAEARDVLQVELGQQTLDRLQLLLQARI